MFAVDEMAYKSPLRAWPPLGKLLLALALLIGSLLSQTPTVPLLVLAIGLALLYRSNKLRLPDIIALACLNTFVMLFVSVLAITLFMPGIPLMQISAAGINFTVSREGVNLALLIFTRAIAGFTVLLFFASSTPIPHLFYAMRSAGLPAFLAELTVLVYRYSFMLLEQMQQMVTAADCRLGFKKPKQAMRTMGTLAAGLFGRSMDFAERAQAALLCRNFRGEFMPYRMPAPLTPVWIVGSVLLLAALIVIGNEFRYVLVI